MRMRPSRFRCISTGTGVRFHKLTDERIGQLPSRFLCQALGKLLVHQRGKNLLTKPTVQKTAFRDRVPHFLNHQTDKDGLKFPSRSF